MAVMEFIRTIILAGCEASSKNGFFSVLDFSFIFILPELVLIFGGFMIFILFVISWPFSPISASFISVFRFFVSSIYFAICLIQFFVFASFFPIDQILHIYFFSLHMNFATVSMKLFISFIAFIISVVEALNSVGFLSLLNVKEFSKFNRFSNNSFFSNTYKVFENLDRTKNMFEVFVISTIFIISSNIIIQSTNLVIFYLGLELQSLCLFLLFLLSVSFSKIEKILCSFIYFIISVFSITIFFNGTLGLYAWFATINFNDLNLLLTSEIASEFSIFEVQKFIELSPSFYTFLIFVSIFIKLGIYPFYSWVPDVYERASSHGLWFISIFSKIVNVWILIKFSSIFNCDDNVLFFFKIFGIFSIIFGSIGALYQSNILRFLGFSSISHMGYILLVIGYGTKISLAFGLFYFVTYVLAIFPFLLILIYSPYFFSSTLCNLKDFRFWIDFTKQSNIEERFLALMFIFPILSLIGLPPFPGFFAKFFVFLTILQNGDYILFSIIIAISFISLYYYLRIIRFIFFDSSKSFMSFDYSTMPYFFKWVRSIFFNIFVTFCFVNLFFIFYGDVIFNVCCFIISLLLCYVIYYYIIILLYYY